MFEDLGAVVLGASFDPPEENRAFRDREYLPFPLLSDETRDVGAAYGVVREPGEPYAEFARRITFLVDPDGIVARVYEVADVAEHAEEVLDDLERLVDPEGEAAAGRA